MTDIPRPPSVPTFDASPRESAGDRDAVDPELLALPDPPRGQRNTTVAVLGFTALASLAMCAALARDASYAFSSSLPLEAGDLNHVALAEFRENAFARGHGLLGAAGAIRYERPFEGDSYRLMPVAGRTDLWAEIRVPSGQETNRFVPPSAFEGRLVRFDRAGLRHRGLAEVVKGTSRDLVPENAWLLVDGETPSRSRWAVTLVALFFGFAIWNLFGIARLVRRVRFE
jgi:hypothetical protein